MDTVEQQKQSKLKNWFGKLSPAVKMTLLNIVSTPLALLTLLFVIPMLFLDNPTRSGMFAFFLIGTGTSLLLTFLSGKCIIVGYRALHEGERNKEPVGSIIYLSGCSLLSATYFVIGASDLVGLEPIRLLILIGC